jgi:PAS domain S-box-containing protein
VSNADTKADVARGDHEDAPPPTERKRAEGALRDSEEALRRNEAWLTEAQRLSHTGTWVLNPTTMQYLYWSDESYRIWEFDPLQGLPSRDALWQRIHDRDRVWEKVQEALRQKKDYSGEFKIVLPNGTVKYLAVTCRHLFSTNGEIVEVIGTNVDVTERKRAEQALRDSEAKFRDFTETASDWFCEMGPDYKFTLLSENAFGSGAADRIGTAYWDHALDLETEPEKWRLLQETVFSRKPFRDFVYRGLSGNGSPMYVRASGKPLFDANGEFRGYRGTCSDVTEITRAQEEPVSLRSWPRTVNSKLSIANASSILADRWNGWRAGEQTMRCILKTFPVFSSFLRERWPPGFPTASTNACAASTANIGGLTTAASQFEMTPGASRAGTFY